MRLLNALDVGLQVGDGQVLVLKLSLERLVLQGVFRYRLLLRELCSV